MQLLVMDPDPDFAAMAIVVEQEEEEAANRRRGDSPSPYQQLEEEEEEGEALDVTVYPQLWDQLDRLKKQLPITEVGSFFMTVMYGLNFMAIKPPSYSDNLKRACYAGWMLLKDSIFPLVSNKLAVFLWTLGHFVSTLSILLSALSILLSAYIQHVEFFPVTLWLVVFLVSILAFALASADLLHVVVSVLRSAISKVTQRNQSTPLLGDSTSGPSGCWLWLKRYTGLSRLLIAELFLFLLHVCVDDLHSNVYYNCTVIDIFPGPLWSTSFWTTTSVSFLLFVVVAQLVLTVKVCITITRELTRSKRSLARRYTLKAFGWFLCQLFFMKGVQLGVLFVLNPLTPTGILLFVLAILLHLASVLSVLGYLLVLHESLEYLCISRLVDFLITLSRLQAMPGLARRRKEKIQHVLECFDYHNCVKEFATIQKRSRMSWANFTYPIRNPMLTLNSLFISALIGATCCGYAFWFCINSSSSTYLIIVTPLFLLFLNFSMVKNALQSVLLFIFFVIFVILAYCI